MGNNIEYQIIEEWRNIIGFEGLYQVSNLGRIKSLNYNHTNQEKILKPQLTKGYYRVTLWKNGKQKQYLVHRLIAIAFIPNPNNLPMINHIDEDKSNNCVDNLEWCDCKYNVNYGTAIERRVKNTDYQKIDYKKRTENTDYKKRTENTDYKKRTENTDYKTIAEKKYKPVIQFDLEGNAIAEYPSIIEAERQTGFQHQNICKCLKGKYKTCGGFIWKYKE